MPTVKSLVKKCRRRRAIVAMVAVLGGGGLAVAADVGVVHATPIIQNCHTIYPANGYQVKCDLGTGQYRAAVECLSGSTYYWQYGYWYKTGQFAGGGKWSNAFCLSGETLLSRQLQTSG